MFLPVFGIVVTLQAHVADCRLLALLVLFAHQLSRLRFLWTPNTVFGPLSKQLVTWSLLFHI